MSEQVDLVKIGVAWTKEGKKGKYMSVQLDLSGIEIPPDGLIHAFLFPNAQRTKDSHPNAELKAKAIPKVSDNQDPAPVAADDDVPF